MDVGLLECEINERKRRKGVTYGWDEDAEEVEVD